MTTTNSRAQFDLVIYKGRDFKMNVYFKDQAGDPADLTGWVGKAQVRETQSSSSPLIFEMPVTVELPLQGKVVVEARDLATDGQQNQGFWDLLMTDPSGYDDTYVLGRVSLVNVPTKK
jgi:hypothetical protein